MENLTIDPNVILKAYKDLGTDDFTLVMLATAYYAKYHFKRLPGKFTAEEHPRAWEYFSKSIRPIFDGKPTADNILTPEQQEEVKNYINKSVLFDDDERRILIDMLDMWWGRGVYARTEMIYTQSMCFSRTGVQSEKFVELRKFLRAEECLEWENKPYGDYLTSYHRFNEIKLYNFLKSDAED